MKHTLTLLLLLTLQSQVLFGQNDYYPKRWSRVYGYELKSLPKSALEVVDSIYVKAKKEKNITQLTKALIYQSKFALVLNEDAEPLVTRKFQQEIRDAKAPLRNVLESVLASVYWEYFQRNRWKYYDRTQTHENQGADFRLWDAQGMFREIHLHFQNSMQDERLLKTIDLSSLHDILNQAENSTTYRPTLFDFLAHNAIDFYEAGENYTSQGESDFTINDPLYFELEHVVQPTRDSLSPQLQAFHLYEMLQSFHQGDKDQTATVQNELERLSFVLNRGVFVNGNELYKSALIKLQSRFMDSPASTLIDFQLAHTLYMEGTEYKRNSGSADQFKKRDALAIIEKAIATFPKTDGADQCRVLKEEILKQSLQILAEEHLPIDKPSRLLVTYTNMDSLNFSVYPISDGFGEDFYRSMNDSMRLAMLGPMRPEQEWKQGLLNLKDYREHSTEVILPGLNNGLYLMVARFSDRGKFAYASIQATNLALIENITQDYYRYQVVDRNTGAPLEGARINLKSKNKSAQNDTLNENFISGKNGFFELKKTKERFYNIVATVQHDKDKAVFGEYDINESYRPFNKREEEFTARAFLFSDRSIFRPGQTVYFKGILTKSKGGKTSLVSGQYVMVTLEDVNSQEVGSLRLKTNAYGSFSGEFKLPSGGLTGEYRLVADEDDEDDSKFYDKLEDFEESELTIAVEEYKRPTFEVTFQPVRETHQLNDTIRVKGNALTFSGAKVTRAKVSYRVKRNVRFPNWYYWSSRNSYSEKQEIGHGESTTDEAGEFSIAFKSIPDEKTSKEELPVFEFEVTADITDVSGETRSATTTVRVGYQSLIAEIVAPASFNRTVVDQSIMVTAKNLNSQSVPASGTVSIYKIKSPSAPQRPRPWPAPDLQQISPEQFNQLFPHDPYTDEMEQQKWKSGKLVSSVPFNTSQSGEVKFKVDKSWELGSYFFELVTADEKGNKIVARSKFELSDPGNKMVPDNKLLILEADQPVYHVGDVAKVKIGSASKDITVVIDVEKGEKTVKTYVKHVEGNYAEVQIPITGGNNENIIIHYSAVNYNAFLSGTNRIQVDDAKKKMEIETISFKDKLAPSQKETWSFEIKGTDPQQKSAEVLASMYDASLDQFKEHQWTFDPIERLNDYYGYNRTSARRSFGTKTFSSSRRNWQSYRLPRLHFDQFDNFGFSITGDSRVKQLYLDRIFLDVRASANISKVSQLNDQRIKKGYVAGRITSEEDGTGLPGVNVVNKGTSIGTVTDADGNYSLPADKGDELVFIFIGFSTIEAKVGRKNVINVSLAEDVQQLSELVATALAVSDKKALYSTAFYPKNSADGYLRGDFKFSASSLQGKVAGVQITGMPGGEASIVLRGARSLNGDINPLYVVDGRVVETSKIDKDDIATIQVLKGAEATALYGTKGENGVILITTKSGQKKLDEELAKVNARKNFNETAFFFPHLNTDESGKIQFTFTTPESLTRWKLQLLAHNRDLESATKTLSALTQKDFMVTPNAPRFLRVGDEIQFSAKITSLVENELMGNAALRLTNAITGESVDPLFQNVVKNQNFKVGAKGNTQVTWKLKVPAGIDAIQYKVVAKAGDFSDGEQNALPVLSNRMLVTETLPMSVRSGETKNFTLEKLRKDTSSTLQHHQLTLEVTSNPAWYAVQALPYLMEYPYECSEQTFARYYANTLATHIANSNPKIREVFDKWASSSALISNLEKNQDLKSTIIEETPWLRDAQNESEQKKRIAFLFEMNRMKEQNQAALNKLQELQLIDGGFTWFAGGHYSSRYITRHIVSGFGHLQALKVVNNKDPFRATLTKAIKYLDNELLRDYNSLMARANAIKMNAVSVTEGTKQAEAFLDQQQVDNEQVHYLYARSFFPEIESPAGVSVASGYYRAQSARYWKSFNLYLKGMIALVQYRAHQTNVADDILKSLKENAIVSDEMGMYWKENKSGWYWNEAPVETQALLIEAFAEIESTGVKDKQKTIDDLRIWLLKNKQTSQWRTTKATSEAIYALLLNGTEWLAINDVVEVSVGGKKLAPPPQSVEAGTGYFKATWKGNAITPAMGKVKLTKQGDGIAWAGLYWQYFEDLDHITAAETPLKLAKKVFLVNHTDKGELLTEVHADTPIAIGSLLRVRIELKADRDMEFLHMKDMRAAGLEPVDVLSEYKWQDHLGYYQSTKDASTSFFFDSVPKGVYAFEYDLRVNNKGNFSNGITTIESMYAPEFSSHSEGIRIKTE